MTTGVEDLDPHHSEKPDPDPHLSQKQDPDLHQSRTSGVLEAQRALEPHPTL